MESLSLTSTYRRLWWPVLLAAGTAVLLVAADRARHPAVSALLLVPLYFMLQTLLVIYNNPPLTFSSQGIFSDGYFNKEMHAWETVFSVTLHAVKYSRSSYRLEHTVVIVYEDGRKNYIWKRLFSNTRDAEELLMKKIREKITDLDSSVDRDQVSRLYGTRYVGNPWFTTGAVITFLVVPASFVLFHDTPPGHGGQWLALFVGLGVCLLASRQMNYFVVERESLVISNHCWRRWRREIPFDDVRSLIVRRKSRSSTMLYVARLSGKTGRYSAGSLQSGDWTRLATDMRAARIPVQEAHEQDPHL